MTNEQLNATGYIVLFDEKSIEPISYRNYLKEYGQDLCTSPNGVADRLHIREAKEQVMKHVTTGETIWESDYKDLEESEQDNYNYYGEAVKEWQVWTWGTGGNNPSHCGPDFDNEEDAILYYYERSEWYVQRDSFYGPLWFSNYDDAVTDMANAMDRKEDVIRRYLNISAITARKEAERKEQAKKEWEARKAALVVEVPAEAATIAVDDAFKTAIEWAEEATGKEKSDRMASAMKGLLERNGISEIKSDFWQVFRILKSRITL